MVAQQPTTQDRQGALGERSFPTFPHTAFSSRFGVDAQILCDEALKAPSDDLPRIALADLLEARGESDLATYIRISLAEPAASHAEELLRKNRQEWGALFLAPDTIFDEPPTLDFHRGLPSRIVTSGSFIWEGWFSPVTIPVQRLLSRYGTPLDESLRTELSSVARYARESRMGTGLNEAEVLVHGVAPVLERLDPVAPHEDLHEAVSSSIIFLRELHERGLDTGRCPRSCLGTAIRASKRELKVSDVHDLALTILRAIDACEGRGAIRGAVFEGLLPLIGALADVQSQHPLQSYLPALSAYVNDLARIGVPMEPVMRHHFLGFVQGLACESSPRHFADLTAEALRVTGRR